MKFFVWQKFKASIKSFLFVLKQGGNVKWSVFVENPERFFLESGAKVGNDCLVFCSGIISIGLFSHVGSRSILCAFKSGRQSDTLEKPKGIVLGSNVLVSFNCVILDGVKIGDNVILGAGSIVLEDTVIPSNELWAGVPAVFKKKL